MAVQRTNFLDRSLGDFNCTFVYAIFGDQTCSTIPKVDTRIRVIAYFRLRVIFVPRSVPVIIA